MVDLHIHTEFSFDSEELPENYVEAARARGIDILGFSEHYDYDAFLDGARLELADVDACFLNDGRLEERYGVKILRGIEFGYRAEAVPKYRELTQKYAFDYVINSVHTLPGRGDCFHDEFFAGKSLKESYRDYFEGVLESVYADYDYQIIGHIGYVSRYRRGGNARIYYPDYADIIDEILKGVIARGKCLEINASTGSSGSAFLPDMDIVKRYLELGGVYLSYGSDAHSCDKYLKKSEELKSALNKLGVCELYYYKERKPVAYKI